MYDEDIATIALMFVHVLSDVLLLFYSFSNLLYEKDNMLYQNDFIDNATINFLKIFRERKIYKNEGCDANSNKNMEGTNYKKKNNDKYRCTIRNKFFTFMALFFVIYAIFFCGNVVYFFINNNFNLFNSLSNGMTIMMAFLTVYGISINIIMPSIDLQESAYALKIVKDDSAIEFKQIVKENCILNVSHNDIVLILNQKMVFDGSYNFSCNVSESKYNMISFPQTIHVFVYANKNENEDYDLEFKADLKYLGKSKLKYDVRRVYKLWEKFVYHGRYPYIEIEIPLSLRNCITGYENNGMYRLIFKCTCNNDYCECSLCEVNVSI